MHRPPVLRGDELTDAISASMVELYARHYDHDRTTATTCINDNVVLCLLEDILSTAETALIAAGDAGDASTGASPSRSTCGTSSPPRSNA